MHQKTECLLLMKDLSNVVNISKTKPKSEISNFNYSINSSIGFQVWFKELNNRWRRRNYSLKTLNISIFRILFSKDQKMYRFNLYIHILDSSDFIDVAYYYDECDKI